MQRRPRQHVKHCQRQQRHREHQADPEAASHVAQFWIRFFFRGYGARLKRHTADGTTTGPGTNDLWMHRAGVLDLCRGNRRFRFERHATFRTSSGASLPNIRIHGTDVNSPSGRLRPQPGFVMSNFGGSSASAFTGDCWMFNRRRLETLRHRWRPRQRNQSQSSRARGLGIFMRLGTEFFQTGPTAEVEVIPFIFVFMGRGCRVHRHTANGIDRGQRLPGLQVV